MRFIQSAFLASCNIMDYSLLLGVYHIKMAPNGEDDGGGDDEKTKDSFHSYAGGLRAEVMEGPGLYYMGIIDTLQVYNLSKKLENFAKVYILRDDANGISCVEPKKYQKRFINYMKHIIITDEEYYRELNVSKSKFSEQNVLIYPGKDEVHRCMEDAQSNKKFEMNNFLATP